MTMTAIKIATSAIRERIGLWLAITFGFAFIYYAALMLSMVMRLGNWPNYFTAYDWFGNVARIIQSTPSYGDMLPIIYEEWLLEIGYMNMSFGHGISEWSLNLVPSKILVMLFLGALIATVWVLAQEQRKVCSHRDLGVTAAGTSAGASLVALTGVTLTWVVCCTTPSWIVGLTMMGVGLATADWIEPAGPWIGAAGFAVLALTLWWQLYSLSKQRKKTSTGLPGMDALSAKA